MSPPDPSRPRRPVAFAVAALATVGALAVLASGCALSPPVRSPAAASPAPGSRGADGCPGTAAIAVVAGESAWGSLAAQLGGPAVEVTTIVSNPDADPHDYEPTAGDARAVARAQEVIVNGVGYDPWLGQLVDANPTPGRIVLDVGDLVGARDGDNPHRWYVPHDVEVVIDAITADYRRLDPADAACFDRRHADLTGGGLARYRELLAELAQRHRGTPVGASESIVTGLTSATGLNLLTPAGFLDAVSEGNDPTAQDKATVDRQLDEHQIAVFIVNGQNATPDVQDLVDRAEANHIPVVRVTETLVPADATFQDWQVGQLEALRHALDAAGGPGA